MLQNLMRKINIITKRKTPILSLIRTKAAYEGEGRTTVRVLNQDYDAGLMIDSYATFGFKLNNGITVLGPMAIFAKSVLSWQVDSSADITEESLRLFKVLDPNIDLVIVGLEAYERAASSRVLAAARANRLNVEILPTQHACSTFNFLNAEGRCVAAALLPPVKVHMNEDDMLRSRLHYGDLYNKDPTV